MEFNHWHDKSKSKEKDILRSAKRTAKRKNMEFNIDLDDIKIPVFCPYLQIRLTRTKGEGRSGSNPSIDRIDSSKGYIKGNVQIISDKANRMKQNADRGELVTFAKNVLKLEVLACIDEELEEEKTTDM